MLLKALSNRSRDRSGGGGAICVGGSTGCSTTLFYSSLYTFSFSPTLRCASSRQEIFSEVLMTAMNRCLYWLLNIIIILLLFLLSSISQSKHWYWSSCHNIIVLSIKSMTSDKKHLLQDISSTKQCWFCTLISIRLSRWWYKLLRGYYYFIKALITAMNRF